MTPGALAAHQIAAVERILELLARRGSALLADEVGLGKSWVAATIAKEFRRGGIPVEIIVPRALVSQWRDLLGAFDLDAEIITHDSLHGTFDFPGAASRLLVIDEAHRFRNPATNRYQALAARCVGSKVLLVTATPICNRLGDLQSLIGLICPDDALLEHGIPSISWSFENSVHDQLSMIIRELVVRRGRDVLPSTLQFGSIDRRVVRFTVSAVQDAIERAVADLRFPLIAAGPAQAVLLRQLLLRRLESSAAALLDSLHRQKRFYRRARESLVRGVRLNKADYRTIFGADEDQVLYQDLLFHDLWLPSGSSDHDVADVDAEVGRLDAVESLLTGAKDEKIQELVRLVQEMAGEQILVFAGAVATARELFRACSEVTASALMTSHFHAVKRMSNLTPDQVLASFSRAECRVLVMTDVGAEGLNLQFAGAVIHYDLPWNPVRIAQRNGRIHRIGQRRDTVRAIYFVPRRESDRVILRRLTAKNRVRRTVLDHHVGDAPRQSAPVSLRSRISRNDPQAILTSVIESKRLLNDETAELLMRRYRAGAELILRQISGEFFDVSRRDYLVALLRREAELTGAFER